MANLEADLDSCAQDIANAPSGRYVIKPSRGFYGVGVHIVDISIDRPFSETLLEEVLQVLRGAVQEVQRKIESEGGFFSKQVLDGATLIVESFLPGPEVAVDMFWDGCTDRPVIVHAYHHPSVGGDSGGNVLYYSSPQIMAAVMPKARELITRLASLMPLGGLALHGEFKLVGAETEEDFIIGEGGGNALLEYNDDTAEPLMPWYFWHSW